MVEMHATLDTLYKGVGGGWRVREFVYTFISRFYEHIQPDW